MQQQLKNNADFCGSLPLHLINHVQGYGVLLVVDKRGMVVQVSQNVFDLLGADAEAVYESAIGDYLAPASAARLAEIRNEKPLGKQLLSLHFISGAEFPVTLHCKEHYDLLEVELQPLSERPFLHHYEELKSAMGVINATRSVEELGQAAVTSLKQHSGFDRVLFYQFDQEWNGTVLAESLEPGMEPYLGLRFPQSDIPAQARALYLRTPYRIIPDREYTPVKLYPIVNPITNSFTDLIDCNLRGVAAMHLEYLKNMGVMSSMSTRILKDGRLWGLISCHHRTALTPSREECAMFELMSEVISSRLVSIEHGAMNEVRQEMGTGLASFVERLYQTRDLAGALVHDEISRQLGAGGMVYTGPDRIRSIGETPEEPQVKMLGAWLQNQHRTGVYSVRNLASEFEEGASFGGVSSGLLSIPVNPDNGEFLLVFRPEEVEEVAWGGDPTTALNMAPDGKTYHPRASFEAWRERVQGSSRPWREHELLFARELKNSINDYLLHRRQ